MTLPLRRYFSAAYPAVAISTVEEMRLLRIIARDFKSHEILTISADKRLRQFKIQDNNTEVMDIKGESVDWATALDKYSKEAGKILVVFDFHRFIQDAVNCRRLKAALPTFKQVKPPGAMCILVAPHWVLPEELRHDIPVLQLPLPSREDLKGSWTIANHVKPCALTPQQETTLLDSAAGLTLAEAEDVFSFSRFAAPTYRDVGLPDTAIVLQEKLRLVKQSGFLEIREPVPMSQVGGLGRLKQYVERRIIPSIEDDQLRVRGLLLAGVSGNGKTLSTRAISSVLGWPVLAASIPRMKGSRLGESEGNIHMCLSIAEAFAPCLLVLDEIEKGVAGYASSALSDAGTTLGMVGILLSWMADHKYRVLTIGTSNAYKSLPPELTNAHRFDECFFCDLPGYTERVEIAEVHLERLGLLKKFSGLVADLTDEWTGAEIEKLIKDTAAYTKRNVTDKAFRETAAEIKTFVSMRGDEVKELREWGRKSMRLANTDETELLNLAAATKGGKVAIN